MATAGDFEDEVSDQEEAEGQDCFARAMKSVYKIRSPEIGPGAVYY